MPRDDDVIVFPLSRTRPPASAYDLVRYGCRMACWTALEYGAECCLQCPDRDPEPPATPNPPEAA